MIAASFASVFAVTAVGARGVLHNPSRDVEELLVVVEQQRDQQRRTAGHSDRSPIEPLRHQLPL